MLSYLCNALQVTPHADADDTPISQGRASCLPHLMQKGNHESAPIAVLTYCESGKQASISNFPSDEATYLPSRRLSKEASCSKPKRTLLLLSQPEILVPCCIRATHASAPPMSIRVSALQNCPIADTTLCKNLLVQDVAGTRWDALCASFQVPRCLRQMWSV